MLALLTFMSISFRAQLRRHWTTLVPDKGGSVHWHLDPVEKMRWYPAVVASWEQFSKGPWKNSAFCSGWWLLEPKKQPMNEMYDVIVKLDDFAKFGGENEKYVKPPHSFILPILCDIHIQNHGLRLRWFHIDVMDGYFVTLPTFPPVSWVQESCTNRWVLWKLHLWRHHDVPQMRVPTPPKKNI